MLQQSLMQAQSPFPNVPLIPSPYAANVTTQPLYGVGQPPSWPPPWCPYRQQAQMQGAALGQTGWGSALAATFIGSALAGALSGSAFYVYQRTNSAAWAGAAAGAGSLALGLIGMGLGFMQTRQETLGPTA